MDISDRTENSVVVVQLLDCADSECGVQGWAELCWAQLGIRLLYWSRPLVVRGKCRIGALCATLVADVVDRPTKTRFLVTLQRIPVCIYSDA